MTDVNTGVARRSALTVAIVLLLIGGWNVYRGRETLAITLAALGSCLIVASLVPSWSRRFHVAWMALASVLGYINSRILLTVVFFVLIAPFGFIMRLFGRDPLNRRGAPRPTYWVPRDHERQTREGFERPF